VVLPSLRDVNGTLVGETRPTVWSHVSIRGCRMGSLRAYSEWRKYFGLANDSRRTSFAFNMHLLALGHGTVCAICVHLLACHTDCCINTSSVNALACMVLLLRQNFCGAEMR
jgi:hypothetical protein